MIDDVSLMMIGGICGVIYGIIIFWVCREKKK